MKKQFLLYSLIPFSIIFGLIFSIVSNQSKPIPPIPPNNNEEISNNTITSGEDISGETIIQEEILEIPSITPVVYDSIKAVYSTGWVAGTENLRKSMIENIKNNGYNAVVLDIKDEAGHLSYNSSVQTAIDVKASRNMIRDINAVLQDFHDNGIYVIGRIVTFKDPTYAKVKTEFAYKKSDGTCWTDYAGNYWPNPYNTSSWEYPIALAKEAAELGFDEIQFDYIRFPSSEGRTSAIVYGFDSATSSKSDTINKFLTKVMDEMADYKIKISADVFGITTKRNGDFENIGQDFKQIANIVDVICPMVYPSHYGYGEYNVSRPDLNPYAIIHGSISDAQKRISGDSGTAEIRPYLQDFTASWLGKGNYQSYGTKAVQDQIQACYDLGIESFTLWDPNNKYCYDALNNIVINKSGE